MSSLCLDTADSGIVTREQAFDTSLIPESTRSYQAIPNAHLIDMIQKAAENQGLVLRNEQLGMAKKGNQLFGVYDVEGMDFFENRISLSFGFYNTYDKSLTARFCAGAKVFICSNLCFNSYCDEETGLSTNTGHRHTSRSLKNDGLWKRLTQSLIGLIIVIGAIFLINIFSL